MNIGLRDEGTFLGRVLIEKKISENVLKLKSLVRESQNDIIEIRRIFEEMVK